jgi:hypothetical protein
MNGPRSLMATITNDISCLLQWINSTALSGFIKESGWAFPTFESIHVIGLTLVVGSISIIDLRLLGWASTGRSYTSMARTILPLTWGAFVIAATAGALMFISNPIAYVANTDFRMKFIFMLTGGINMALFHLLTARGAGQWDLSHSTPLPVKLAGAVSIICWIAVVLFGRRIGFSMALS